MSLLIETGRLRQKKEKISGEEPCSLLEINLGETISPQGALKYDLTAQKVSGELIVQGRLEMNFTCRCARCGDNFNKKVVIADFCRNFALTTQNELINLTADVREDILLALPLVAVCSGNCRGLCMKCGVNLNREKCKCRRQTKTDVWQALDDLRLK